MKKCHFPRRASSLRPFRARDGLLSLRCSSPEPASAGRRIGRQIYRKGSSLVLGERRLQGYLAIASRRAIGNQSIDEGRRRWTWRTEEMWSLRIHTSTEQPADAANWGLTCVCTVYIVYPQIGSPTFCGSSTEMINSGCNPPFFDDSGGFSDVYDDISVSITDC